MSESVETARRLLKEATPEPLVFMRYDHGGARLYKDRDDVGRDLIADFYDEGNRELYYAAPRLLSALCDENEALRKALADILQCFANGSIPHNDIIQAARAALSPKQPEGEDSDARW